MNIKGFELIQMSCDLLVIGGGIAGCQGVLRAREIDPNLKVILVEKADIVRSGCTAAGVNAINAYLSLGETPQSYTEYVKKDSAGLIREDLTYSIGERLNRMVEKLDQYGVPFMKDQNGYVVRGKRSIKVNGENIKPILAEKVNDSDIVVLNRVVASNYIVEDGRVKGVYAFSIRSQKFYYIQAKAVLCATGGVSGIYKPNNPGSCRHKMWYSPFNTGAGLAMGVRAGAEMTTFEMRFIALRVKDVIAPTGTLAQGVGAVQVNEIKQKYMVKYQDRSTPNRLFATVKENREGRGPCYLDLSHITQKDAERLRVSYLNMSPGIVLKWADEEFLAHENPVEIDGTEPYVVGGHGQAGYWVDSKRATTLEGLFSAGDVTGGSPKKYVSGCMAEAEIAVESALETISAQTEDDLSEVPIQAVKDEFDRVMWPLTDPSGAILPIMYEERLQKLMDEYAGGISTYYELSEQRLLIARKRLKVLSRDIWHHAYARNLHELMNYHEVLDRVLLAHVLVEHLIYRKETRWKCYQERVDYPERDNKHWKKFVNSVYNKEKKSIRIVERELETLEILSEQEIEV